MGNCGGLAAPQRTDYRIAQSRKPYLLPNAKKVTLANDNASPELISPPKQQILPSKSHAELSHGNLFASRQFSPELSNIKAPKSTLVKSVRRYSKPKTLMESDSMGTLDHQMRASDNKQYSNHPIRIESLDDSIAQRRGVPREKYNEKYPNQQLYDSPSGMMEVQQIFEATESDTDGLHAPTPRLNHEIVNKPPNIFQESPMKLDDDMVNRLLNTYNRYAKGQTNGNLWQKTSSREQRPQKVASTAVRNQPKPNRINKVESLWDKPYDQIVGNNSKKQQYGKEDDQNQYSVWNQLYDRNEETQKKESKQKMNGGYYYRDACKESQESGYNFYEQSGQYGENERFDEESPDKIMKELFRDSQRFSSPYEKLNRNQRETQYNQTTHPKTRSPPKPEKSRKLTTTRPQKVTATITKRSNYQRQAYHQPYVKVPAYSSGQVMEIMNQSVQLPHYVKSIKIKNGQDIRYNNFPAFEAIKPFNQIQTKVYLRNLQP